MKKITAVVAVGLVLAAAAGAADWWYKVTDGDKHVGYCHAVESTQNLSGVVCKRTTYVTETDRDAKSYQYNYKRTVDYYHDAAGALLLYSSVTTFKGNVTKVTVARKTEKKFKGMTVTITEKAGTEKEKVTALDIAETAYTILEPEEALSKITSPGNKVEGTALNFENGKIEKVKIEYVADQMVDVGGESIAAKVLAAKAGWGGASWYFNAEGGLVKYAGPSARGKITMTRVADAASATPPQ